MKSLFSLWLILYPVLLFSQKTFPSLSVSSYPAPAARSQYTVSARPASLNPQDLVSYLIRHIPALRPAQTGLELLSFKESPAGIHYLFRQTYRGYPVHQAQVKINLSKAGAVLSISENAINMDEVLIPGQEFPSPSLLPPDTSVEERQTSREWILVSGRLIPCLVVKEYHSVSSLLTERIIDKEGHTLFSRLLTRFHRKPAVSDSTVSALVFNPDPLTTAQTTYGAPFTDSNDADVPELNARRVPVSLKVNYNAGIFSLSGPYVKMADFSPPAIPPVTQTFPDFSFTRSNDGFEDVNAYYHIHTYQEYIQSLGFTNICNYQVEVDAHALSGSDNSQFNPGTPPRIYFGEGGVDDAEDADVIIHEYGHALSEGAAPNTNNGQERSAIDEALGDYFAASYSRSINPYRWEFVFSWDGHNEFWDGRKAVSNKKYPGDLVFDIYEDAEIWSSTLMQVWGDIGRTDADRILLQSLYSYFSNMTMCDAARLYLQADSLLNGGKYFPVIMKYFLQRGFCGFPSEDTCYYSPGTLFTVDAGPDTSVCNEQTVKLGGSPAVSGASPDYSVLWQPSAGLSCTACPNPVAHPQQTTLYKIMVFDEGCVRSDSVRVTVTSCFKKIEIRNTEAFARGSDALILKVPYNTAITNVVLYNLVGQQILVRQYEGNEEIRIPPLPLAQGLYLLRATSGDYTETFKIEKIH